MSKILVVKARATHDSFPGNNDIDVEFFEYRTDAETKVLNSIIKYFEKFNRDHVEKVEFDFEGMSFSQVLKNIEKDIMKEENDNLDFNFSENFIQFIWSDIEHENMMWKIIDITTVTNINKSIEKLID